MVATSRLEPLLDPLALVVFDDEGLGRPIVNALKNRGFRTFSIPSILGDAESLDGLRPEVIVLAVKIDTFAAAKTLLELSKRPLSPPVVLVADADAARGLASRFRLLSLRPGGNERELLHTIEQSRREGRRPISPS